MEIRLYVVMLLLSHDPRSMSFRLIPVIDSISRDLIDTPLKRGLPSSEKACRSLLSDLLQPARGIADSRLKGAKPPLFKAPMKAVSKDRNGFADSLHVLFTTTSTKELCDFRHSATTTHVACRRTRAEPHEPALKG